MAVKPIPEGYPKVTPSFSVKGCAQAIDFIETVFDARTRCRYDGPGGSVMHAEIDLGDSLIMCGDAGVKGAWNLHAMIYVDDCDVTYERAVKAGATATEPLKDQFYGDRSGRVTDPWGNVWYIATHKEDVSPEEMDRRMKAMQG